MDFLQRREQHGAKGHFVQDARPMVNIEAVSAHRRHTEVTNGSAAFARSADMTVAGPMPTQCGGPRPSGSPCSFSSSVTSDATAPAGHVTRGSDLSACQLCIRVPHSRWLPLHQVADGTCRGNTRRKRSRYRSPCAAGSVLREKSPESVTGLHSPPMEWPVRKRGQPGKSRPASASAFAVLLCT